MRLARVDYWKMMLVGILVFFAVFVFTLLVQRNALVGVQAADTSKFDAGYIISDYQMGNYTSMTEAEIQAWLTSMNSCANTDYAQYQRMTAASPSISWHWADGHFVCLSEELFGDGEVIGSGETAAHIIWQAAQDYHINPQVLLVLLQKESSLITDTIPNNLDYRKATGYGCPDTAPCSAEYYGFKNQIRKAAELFHTVLSGGWTNYPLGDNYVRYNSNAACGGSVVNIRSLATSALYRYTPYQPFGGYLEDGTNCNATGNINFYTLFEEWWGGIRDESARYVSLDVPRYMEVAEDVDRIKSNMEIYDKIEKGRILKFTTKTILNDGTACLRTEFATNNKEDACIPIGSLKNVELVFEEIVESQEKIIKAGAKKVYIRGETELGAYAEKMIRKIVAKTVFNGRTYYITEYDKNNSRSEYGFLEDDIEEIPQYENLESTISMTPKNTTGAIRMDPITGRKYDKLAVNVVYKFNSMIVVDGVKYYRTEHNTANNIEMAVREDELVEVDFVEFDFARDFRLKGRAARTNPVTNETLDLLEGGRVIRFTTKIFINGRWYYRTEHNTKNNLCMAIAAEDVEEVE